MEILSNYLNKISNYLICRNENYYYLSLKYENGKWTIHGLWPQYNKDSYPKYCSNTKFELNSLKPIISQLNRYWCSDKYNIKFWEHEWKKHGTCMFNNCDELNYFKMGLKLFEDLKFSKNFKEIINKYKEDNKCLIPYDLNFNLMNTN